MKCLLAERNPQIIHTQSKTLMKEKLVPKISANRISKENKDGAPKARKNQVFLDVENPRTAKEGGALRADKDNRRPIWKPKEKKGKRSARRKKKRKLKSYGEESPAMCETQSEALNRGRRD